MELFSILRPEAVRIVTTGTSKKRLLQDLSDLAADSYGVTSGTVCDALLERETLGPTGVGKGIALPHARLTGLSHVIGVFMRLDKPVDFDAVDRQNVDLVFGLLAPSETGVDHLKALALVSRTLRNTSICAKLRSANDTATLHAILTEAAATEAA